MLGGDWTLPEGTTVTSKSTTTFDGEFAIGRQTLRVQDASSDVTRTVMDSVANGRLMRAVQTLESVRRRFSADGQPVPSDLDPMLGRAVRMQREGDRWTQSPLGWRPDEAQKREMAEPFTLDDAEYPAHPLAVGETYEVPDAVIPLVYTGATSAPRRLTLRLDSLGTVGDVPVAHLTQTVLVTVDTGDGDTMTMDMTAQVVRHLGWMLDVKTRWQGDITVHSSEGTMTGAMDYRETQTAALPD